jgi:hypothetical protein
LFVIGHRCLVLPHLLSKQCQGEPSPAAFRFKLRFVGPLLDELLVKWHQVLQQVMAQLVEIGLS